MYRKNSKKKNISDFEAARSYCLSYRQRKNKSQNDVARLIGCRTQYISFLEQGRFNNCTIDTVENLLAMEKIENESFSGDIL